MSRGTRRHVHSALFIALALMGGAGIAPAVTVLAGGTNWTAAFDAGGVTGDVGCLLDPFDGSASGVIEGYYGHSVDGPTCQGSDTRIKTNYLLVKLTRELNDPVSIGVVASVTMHKINSLQHTLDNNCVIGPPTWTGQGIVTAYRPAKGLAGSDVESARAHDSYAHVSPTTNWAHNDSTVPPLLQFQDQTDVAILEWDYDENDPSTNSLDVSTKIRASLTGTGIEIIVNSCDLEARVTLEVTVA